MIAMKRTLCLLVQRRLDPDSPPVGWLASHLDSCAECRMQFEMTRTLESKLRSPVPEHDQALCEAIMSQIELVPSPVPRSTPTASVRPWILGASAVAAAVALVISFTSPTKPKPSGPVQVQSPPVASEAVPSESQELPRERDLENPPLAFTDLLRQQELLQRDTLKLGEHLRERVILFRPAE